MSSMFEQSLTQGIKLANELGLLKQIKLLFVADYQESAGRLADVLGELEKNYTAIDEELDRFATLRFQSADTDREAEAKLKDLKSVAVEARMQHARGHCSRIKNICDTYLNARVAQLVVQDDRLSQVLKLFYEMSDTDGQMMLLIEGLSTTLGTEIAGLTPIVTSRDFESANRRILETTAAAAKQRRSVKRAIVDLLRLRADYIEVAGVA